MWTGAKSQVSSVSKKEDVRSDEVGKKPRLLMNEEILGW